MNKTNIKTGNKDLKTVTYSFSPEDIVGWLINGIGIVSELGEMVNLPMIG